MLNNFRNKLKKFFKFQIYINSNSEKNERFYDFKANLIDGEAEALKEISGLNYLKDGLASLSREKSFYNTKVNDLKLNEK